MMSQCNNDVDDDRDNIISDEVDGINYNNKGWQGKWWGCMGGQDRQKDFLVTK